MAYTDTIAPRFISLLLAAALYHRRRTGEGCWFDVAQIEASLHFLAPEMLDLQANGYSATHIGNRSTACAPQACFPCAGHPYRIRGYDNGPRGPAPTLGQHSFEILSGFLGLDDETVAAAYASGAVA